MKQNTELLPLSTMLKQQEIWQQIITKQAELNELIAQLQVLSPELSPTKKKPSKRSNDLEILKLYGITGTLAQDFIVLRKVKKAPITDTAMSRMYHQAIIAGISMIEAVEICIERNWQGFKAEWYQQTVNKPSTNVTFFDSINSQDF